MLFNSYIFVLLFFPVCLLGYYYLNSKKLYTPAQVFLIGMSLWFYGYFHPSYLVIILASVGFNYLMYLLMKKYHTRLLLVLGLGVNIGVLIYFKYMDFFIQNINTVFRTNLPLLHILLPLGISFFTFQQISFLVDAWRNEVPDYRLVDYAAFVTYFPQLIAGPIVTHDELIPQFRDAGRKTVNWDNFAKGIYIFVIGLAKKVLLADTFGNAVNVGYENLAALDTVNALLVILGYTLQIYFDFSGYCDMAIGIGKMMNIDLPVNFNSPYKAKTIQEFWDRWHMTLTRFFTRYVYIPLGGSRQGATRTALNIMIVFLLSGFWHGAAWTFVFWGVCHGLLSVLTRFCKKQIEAIPAAVNWLVTFVLVNILWVFFRAESFSDALCLLGKAAQLTPWNGIRGDIVKCFRLPEATLILSRVPGTQQYPALPVFFFYALGLFLVLGTKNSVEKMEQFKPSVWNMLFSAVLAAWCVISFSGISTFLYFNF